MIFLPFQLLLLLSLDALKTSAFRDPSLPNPYTYSFEHQDRRQPQQTALKQDRHRQGWPQTERKQNRQRTNSLETGQTQAGLTSNRTETEQTKDKQSWNRTDKCRVDLKQDRLLTGKAGRNSKHYKQVSTVLLSSLMMFFFILTHSDLILTYSCSFWLPPQ